MPAGLSKSKKLKSIDQVRQEMRRAGMSAAQWAREHNANVDLVYEVFRGRPCHRGESHRIAVLLGIKDGVIDEAT